MTLQDLIQTIRTSNQNDWHNIGANGPLFNHRIIMNGDTPETDQHLEYASYNRDLQITIGWDLVDNDDFQAPYANNNPDRHANGMWLDVFYNGALVFRTMYVSVDGNRCNLPIPTNNNGTWEVSNEQADFIFVINAIHGLDRADYNRYLNTAGIAVVNAPWNY